MVGSWRRPSADHLSIYLSIYTSKLDFRDTNLASGHRTGLCQYKSAHLETNAPCLLQCRYVPEYLAVGEAPEQVRNCFQQRSRWCKGHYQVIFSRKHCPLLQRRLSFLMKARP